MSNTLAIAAVTSTIRFVLSQALGGAQPGPVGSAAVTTMRPDQVAGHDDLGEPAKGINVYLHQVTPNHAWNLTDLPTRRADGSLSRRPVAALDLHYLISCFGDDTHLDAQRLLGRAVLALAMTPVLTRDLVAAALDQYDGDTATAFLADADLADQVELVKLAPAAVTVEEMSRLWGMLGAPYLLSLAYTATVVLLEADVSPRIALPVRQRTVGVAPIAGPRIRSVDTDPAHGPVLTGTELHVLGSGLLGDDTAVRIGAVSLHAGRCGTRPPAGGGGRGRARRDPRAAGRAQCHRRRRHPGDRAFQQRPGAGAPTGRGGRGVGDGGVAGGRPGAAPGPAGGGAVDPADPRGAAVVAIRPGRAAPGSGPVRGRGVAPRRHTRRRLAGAHHRRRRGQPAGTRRRGLRRTPIEPAVTARALRSRDAVAAELDLLRALVRGESGDEQAQDLALARDLLDGPSRLDEVADGFGLTGFERSVLLLAAGPDLVGATAADIAALGAGERITFASAMSVLPDAHWSAATPPAPLRHWGLVELLDPVSAIRSPLIVDERVLHHLAGAGHLDARLAACSRPVPAPGWLPATLAAAVGEVVAAWRADRCVVLHGAQRGNVCDGLRGGRRARGPDRASVARRRRAGRSGGAQ